MRLLAQKNNNHFPCSAIVSRQRKDREKVLLKTIERLPWFFAQFLITSVIFGGKLKNVAFC
ncbi:hypothetical protein EY693_07915 [Enterococcus casseliflavus]|nr:hypothetical protein [Enterococcus casseliflavus]MBO6376259.1 hypothetical protein [Enterococcus casseliflavus]MBO6386573.1 hypothetical protein [Enterococcus casseliflavus]